MATHSSERTATWVIRTLREAGHEALLAGGCVRDRLLGLGSDDYDVATSARPEEVRALFRRVLMVGAAFGVAVVMRGDEQVEVATFRSDVSYSDGRRPDAIRYAGAREDALRRDFTINGMFYDPLDDRLIDYVGGRADLAEGVVRTIGRPDRRFAEDYLRMLRAPRFAVRFGFRIDEATAGAIRAGAGNIAAISGERILDELSKMLARDSAPQALGLIESLALAGPILPELFEPDDRAWTRGRDRVANLPHGPAAPERIAALLADLPAETIDRIVRRWGGSNRLRKTARFVSEHLADRERAPEAMSLAELKRLLADEDFIALRAAWRAEDLRTGTGSGRDEALGRRIDSIDPERVDPPPLVTGADLMEMGLVEGPRLGRVLEALRTDQLNERFADREEALAAARERVESAGDSAGGTR